MAADWPAIISAFGPALTALALVITALGVIYNMRQGKAIKEETHSLKADVKEVHTLVNSDKTLGMQAQLILLLQNVVLLRDTPPSEDRDKAIAVAQAQIVILEKALADRATAQAVIDGYLGTVAASVPMPEGTVIMPGTIIPPGTVVPEGTIIPPKAGN